MGFLGSFNPVKIVSNVIRNPVSAIPKAVVSGGASLVSPQISKALDPLTATLYNPQLLPVAASVAGGVPMGFNIGGFLGGVGNILSGSQVPVFQNLGQIAGSIAPSFLGERPPSGAVPQPGMPVPIQPSGGQTITKEVFDAAQKLLARLGIAPRSMGAWFRAVDRVMRSIAALARKTPAGTIVSLLIGLGLTALETNLLVTWWATKRLKKRRRMNAANAKALRRAARRIRSFHRLCQLTDVVKTRAPRRGRIRGRTIVLCPTCRANPCRC